MNVLKMSVHYTRVYTRIHSSRNRWPILMCIAFSNIFKIQIERELKQSGKR